MQTQTETTDRMLVCRALRQLNAFLTFATKQLLVLRLSGTPIRGLVRFAPSCRFALKIAPKFRGRFSVAELRSLFPQPTARA